MVEMVYSGTASDLYNVSEKLRCGAVISKIDGTVLVAGPNGKESLLDFSDPQFARQAQQAQKVLGISPHEIKLTV
jgi:hypothetical protein